jgi:hypothetical protein
MMLSFYKVICRPLIGSEHSAVHIRSSQTPTLLHVLECQEPIVSNN